MLETSLETVCFVIIKAREFDVGEGVVETDTASNPSDDLQVQVLAAHDEHLIRNELTSFIDNLNEDQQAELVALTWLGRDEETSENWEDAVAAARERQTGSTAEYLLGMPLLADLLEEGLSRLGFSCQDVAEGRL